MAKPPAGIHAEDIKAYLRKHLGPITVLSEAWGYHRAGISNALRDVGYSVPLERRIAEALGLPPNQVWPDRWAADGTPLPRIARTGSRPAANSETSQKRRAA